MKSMKFRPVEKPYLDWELLSHFTTDLAFNVRGDLQTHLGATIADRAFVDIFKIIAEGIGQFLSPSFDIYELNHLIAWNILQNPGDHDREILDLAHATTNAWPGMKEKIASHKWLTNAQIDAIPKQLKALKESEERETKKSTDQLVEKLSKWQAKRGKEADEYGAKLACHCPDCRMIRKVVIAGRAGDTSMLLLDADETAAFRTLFGS